MPFMGLYTQKEVNEIKQEERKLGYEDGCRYTKVECKREESEIVNNYESIIDDKSKANISLKNDIEDLKIKLMDAVSDIKDRETKIDILEFFLCCEYDKKIDRLEKIAKRTKKFRIKKKCESKILDYQMRKLAHE